MPSFEITVEAEKDLEGVVEYTANTWGLEQVRKYMAALGRCMERLAKGDEPYKSLDKLYPGIRMMHCQHHYIFGVTRENQPFLIVAVLHERMELMQRLKRRLEATQ